MAQPTGATPLNSTWTGKGLKAGLYITESGAFVFDSGGTPTAATGGGWVTDASNTDPSGPNGDIIVTSGVQKLDTGLIVRVAGGKKEDVR